jgi:hypothetical protein
VKVGVGGNQTIVGVGDSRIISEVGVKVGNVGVRMDKQDESMDARHRKTEHTAPS